MKLKDFTPVGFVCALLIMAILAVVLGGAIFLLERAIGPKATSLICYIGGFGISCFTLGFTLGQR